MVKKTTKSKSVKAPKRIKEETSVIETKETKTSLLDFLKFGESYTSLILGIIVVIVATVLLLSFVKTRGSNNGAAKNPAITQELTQEQAQGLQPTTSEMPIVSPTETLTPTAVPTVTAMPTAVVKKIVTQAPTAKVEKKQIAQISQTKQQEPQAKSGKTYTVIVGDSLWSIAEQQYKSGYNWVDIARANNLSNPGDIHTGNKLIIPDISPKLATVTAIPTAEPTVIKPVQVQNTNQSTTNVNKIIGKTYAVEKGDNLWSIAVRAYGDGYQWTKIAQANGLSNNPGLIFSGNVLKIPRE